MLMDLVLINVIANLVLHGMNDIFYHLFITLVWLGITYYVQFYEVYRYTKITDVISKIFRLYVGFVILNFAYLGFFVHKVDNFSIFKYTIISVIAVGIFKFGVFFMLRKYRSVYKGNLRITAIIGNDYLSKQLVRFFNDNDQYGYNLVSKTDGFANKDELMKYLHSLKAQHVEELYCSLESLPTFVIENVIGFTDNHLIRLKFLPSKNEVLVRSKKYDYYGVIPVYAYRQIPLESRSNFALKRLFDILFSSLVIVFVLSWLTPLMSFLIKRESNGPVFFKQKRNGLDYKEFMCYKFRSMHINEIADLEQVSKNDPRITEIGKFIRKSSIDELPQFYNVFLGDMSVVGPRPHMVSHTEMYAKSIDKFMVRHFIKPGITGLAQTSGYRGEVETQRDIINRVRYDIFYLENWSLLLDIKIIFLTVYNAVKGEKKAY